jgi:phenylacetate-coenzyme A ligase PaaK-like adenylate-forming protein
MVEYETLRQKHVADMTRLLPEHLQRIDWPAERLREERKDRLRTLVRAAKARSAWHRERLADVDPEGLREEDLQSLPVMTKDDLMTNWDDVVTDDCLTLALVESHIESLTKDAYLLDRYHAVASGGSSGRRGVFVYDWDAWTLCYLEVMRWAFRAIMNDPELAAAPPVVASIASQPASHMGSSVVQTFTNPSLPIHRFPISLPMEEIVTGLNKVQPTFLQGFPSALYLLAHEARKGNLCISPMNVSASSEPLWPEIRAALEKTWDAPVGNLWGTSEGGAATAISCGQGSGMHLPDDLLIIDPVDEEGNPVPPGVASAKVYLTNLYNPALPLIRYEITDEVTLLEEPCPCGSAHRRVDDIQGRLHECFAYPGGITVHPLIFRSPLSRERNVVEYQIRQTVSGADVAIRCVGKVDVPRLRGKIADALSKLGLEDPDVTVTTAEEFERTAAGKLKRFIPLSQS